MAQQSSHHLWLKLGGRGLGGRGSEEENGRVAFPPSSWASEPGNVPCCVIVGVGVAGIDAVCASRISGEVQKLLVIASLALSACSPSELSVHELRCSFCGALLTDVCSLQALRHMYKLCAWKREVRKEDKKGRRGGDYTLHIYIYIYIYLYIYILIYIYI